MTIGKFDYKKWVVENKYGSLKEQITQAETYIGCGLCDDSSQTPGEYACAPGIEFQITPDMTNTNVNPNSNWDVGTLTSDEIVGGFESIGYEGTRLYRESMIDGVNYYDYGGIEYWCPSGSAMTPTDGPTVTASTSSDAFTGDAGGDATNFTQGDFDFNTDCGPFNELPQDFKDLICQSCEDPTYISMQCECCNQESDAQDQAVPIKTPDKGPEKDPDKGPDKLKQKSKPVVPPPPKKQDKRDLRRLKEIIADTIKQLKK